MEEKNCKVEKSDLEVDLINLINKIKMNCIKILSHGLDAVSLGDYQKSAIGYLESFESSFLKHVLLLSGEVGCGKTSICLEYARAFWQCDSINTTNYMPIYISLSKYRKDLKGFLKRHFIEELLLTEENYKLLCEQGRLLLILDDYEVIERLDWLREYLREEKERPSWERLKIVVVCKDIHLIIQQENYESAFYPIDEEKLKVEWFQAKNINILSENDQRELIMKYLSIANEGESDNKITKWKCESYELYRENVPGIKELLCNIQMLIIFLNYLPTVFNEPSEDKVRKKIVTKNDTIIIYEKMLETWKEKEIEKHVFESDSFLNQGQDEIREICEILARVMAEYEPRKGGLSRVELVKIISQGVNRKRVEQALLLSPLRCNKETGLGFMNGLMQAYFEKMSNQEGQLTKEKKGLFDKEVKILRHMEEQDWQDNLLNTTVLSERVVNEIAYKINLGDVYWVERCMSYIRKSTECEVYAMASVNSGTILARGEVNLSWANFRGAKLSAYDQLKRKQVGADLSEGIFDQADFSFSDLRGVKFKDAWLRGAIFTSAKLTDICLMQEEISFNNGIDCSTLSPNNTLLIADKTSRLHLYDLTEKKEGKVISLKNLDSDFEYVSPISISTSISHRIAIAAEIGIINGPMKFVVMLIDLESEKLIKIWDLKAGLSCVRLNESQNYIACCGFDNNITILSISGIEKTLLTGHESSVSYIDISSSNDVIVSVASDQTLRRWQNGKCVDIEYIPKGMNFVAFNPKLNQVALCGSNINAYIWEYNESKLLTLSGHTYSITAVTYHSNGELIATSSEDCTVKLWNLKCEQIFNIHTANTAVNIGFSLYGRTVVIQQERKFIVSEYNDKLTTLSFDNAGNSIFVETFDNNFNCYSFCYDGILRVFDLKTGKVQKSLEMGVAWKVAKSLISNKYFLGFSHAYNAIMICDMKTLCSEKRLSIDGDIYSIDCSEDGRKLLVCSSSHPDKMLLWDIQKDLMCKEIEIIDHKTHHHSFFVSDGQFPDVIFVARSTLGLYIYNDSSKNYERKYDISFDFDWSTSSACFLKKEKVLLLGDLSGQICIVHLDIQGIAEIGPFQISNSQIKSMAYIENRKKIIVGTEYSFFILDRNFYFNENIQYDQKCDVPLPVIHICISLSGEFIVVTLVNGSIICYTQKSSDMEQEEPFFPFWRTKKTLFMKDIKLDNTVISESNYNALML